MFFKKFLSILTYFVWKKVWLLKLAYFQRKNFGKIFLDSPEKFVRTHRTNLSGLTGKIFPLDVLALNSYTKK